MRRAALSVWRDSGQPLAAKCIQGEGVWRGATITHWCGRQGDVTPLRDFLNSTPSSCTAARFFPLRAWCKAARMGWRNAQLWGRLPRAFVRWCMCEHALSISPHLFVCFFFLSPPTTSKLSQERWALRMPAQARSTWTQTKWVRKVQLECSGLRRVYVCASMCDRFLISLGLRSFPALTKIK